MTARSISRAVRSRSLSAAAAAEREESMSDDIKPRLRVPATAKKGEVVEIKTLVTHPMENGQRKGADGKLIPRLIVNSLHVTYNDRPVVDVTLEPAVAANPYLSFFLRVPESGTLK